MTADEILEFWFGARCESLEEIEALVQKCFMVNPALDEEIRSRYGDLPDRAGAGEFDAWTEDPRRAVALIIVLDQFPRNLFRGEGRAFAYDARALAIARAWVLAGGHRKVAPIEATFGCLPFEHAESLEDQEQCVALYEETARQVPEALRAQFESFVSYGEQHRVIIERFGRFPHRNAPLGRVSTAEERAFLDEGGETFTGSQVNPGTDRR